MKAEGDRDLEKAARRTPRRWAVWLVPAKGRLMARCVSRRGRIAGPPRTTFDEEYARLWRTKAEASAWVREHRPELPGYRPEIYRVDRPLPAGVLTARSRKRGR